MTDAPAGHLYITEYNNMGDLSLETPMEPPLRVQRVEIGTQSLDLDKDTRIVALFATAPCRFSFLSDSESADAEGWEARAVPLSDQQEVIRVTRLNTKMRVAVYEHAFW